MPDDSRVVPTPAAPDLPTKTILVNGSTMPAGYRVMSVKVNHTAHRIPEAEIILLDGDVTTETFDASNGSDFMPGVEIEIKAGYHGEEDTIFKGMIVKQGIKILQGRASVMQVVAKHKLFKSTLNRKNNAFKDKKDSEVIEELVTEAKEVEPTTTTHKHLLQPYCTDWDFINLRAEANGMFVLPHYDKLYVKKPVLDGDAALSLYYGTSILEFEAEMDARNAFTEVKVSGWSAGDQQLIDSSASNEWNGKEPGNFTSNDAASALGNLREAADTGELSDQLGRELCRFVIVTPHLADVGCLLGVGHERLVGLTGSDELAHTRDVQAALGLAHPLHDPHAPGLDEERLVGPLALAKEDLPRRERTPEPRPEPGHHLEVRGVDDGVLEGASHGSSTEHGRARSLRRGPGPRQAVPKGSTSKSAVMILEQDR